MVSRAHNVDPPERLCQAVQLWSITGLVIPTLSYQELPGDYCGIKTSFIGVRVVSKRAVLWLELHQNELSGDIVHIL